MSSKLNTVIEIRKLLAEFTLLEALEIIGNVLIYEGLWGMDIHRPPSDFDIANTALSDMKEQGPTPANSAVLYGVNLLEALNRTIQRENE